MTHFIVWIISTLPHHGPLHDIFLGLQVCSKSIYGSLNMQESKFMVVQFCFNDYILGDSCPLDGHILCHWPPSHFLQI